MSSTPYLEFEDYPSTNTPLSATNLNNMQVAIADIVNENTDNIGDVTTLTTTDKTSLVNAINEVNEKNIITVGLSANTNVSIGTAWTYYTLNLNTLNASIGSKLTFDSTNHRITVGDGVSYVKVSACGLLRGVTSDIEINIRRNEAIMGTAANRWTNATYFMNLSITDILVPVSSGDYFDIAIRTGAIGTVVVGGGQYTKLTVEVID